MWLLEGVLSSAAGISLVSWSKGPRFFGQVDSALDSNPGPGFFCWWVQPLDGVGKLVSRGRVPARYLQLHLHQEDSVMVGEDLVYSLIVTLL